MADYTSVNDAGTAYDPTGTTGFTPPAPPATGAGAPPSLLTNPFAGWGTASPGAQGGGSFAGWGTPQAPAPTPIPMPSPGDNLPGAPPPQMGLGTQPPMGLANGGASVSAPPAAPVAPPMNQNLMGQKPAPAPAGNTYGQGPGAPTGMFLPTNLPHHGGAGTPSLAGPAPAPLGGVQGMMGGLGGIPPQAITSLLQLLQQPGMLQHLLNFRGGL